MKCSVFIATSVDGIIAQKDGNVDWLHSTGKSEADMGANSDMGYSMCRIATACGLINKIHLADARADLAAEAIKSKGTP